MAESTKPTRFWRWRVLLRWFLLIIALLYFGFVSEDTEVVAPVETIDTGADESEVLQIAEIRPVKVAPSGVVVLTLGRDPSNGDASTDETSAQVPVQAFIGSTELERIHQRGPTVAFKIANDATPGRYGLLIRRGSEQSRLHRIEVRPTNPRKIIRSVVGGLALATYAMYLLSSGLRRITSGELRESVERLIRGKFRALVVGFGLGGITQSGPATSVVVVGLLDNRLVSTAIACWVLTGTQLGMATSGALLPLVSNRDALILVAVGVAWLFLSEHRHHRAAAKILMGVGLLLHGVYLLRLGFASVPESLEFLGILQRDSISGLFVSGIVGLGLAIVVQGPGPVFALVLGLLQSTNLVQLEDGLAILTGAMVGTVWTGMAIAWPFAGKARRTLFIHGILVVVSASVALIALPIWLAFAQWMLDSDPQTVAYGKKLLYPEIGPHLAVSFLVSQAMAVVVQVIGLRLFDKRLGRALEPRGGEAQWRNIGTVAVRVNEVLSLHAQALELCGVLVKHGQRNVSGRIETILGKSRGMAQSIVSDSLGQEQKSFESISMAVFALVHLQTSMEALRLVCDRSAEHGAQLNPSENAILDDIHRLVSDGFRENMDALSTATGVDFDSVQSREIQINGLELAYRREWRLDRETENGRIESSVFLSQVIDGYESVGNHLYRVAHSLEGIGLVES